MRDDTQDRKGTRTRRWLNAGWATAGGLLTLPFLAMQWDEGVNWTAHDFLFAGVLMGTVGVLAELTVRLSGSAAYRAATGFAVAAAVLLIWSNGAVGIIGAETLRVNMLYPAIPLLALIGSAAVRFRADGMAIAMAFAGLAQVLVPIAVLVAGLAPADIVLDPAVAGATAILAGLWLTSAFLYRRA